METRHPIEGLFGSEFPAICNYCVVMTAWSRKTWKFCEQFLRFLERPLMVKCSKFCSESLHGDIDWRCCIAPKICQNPTPVVSLLPPGLPPGTIARTVSSERLSCCFQFFLIFSFLYLALDDAGDVVSFWAHVNLPYRIVSYRSHLLVNIRHVKFVILQVAARSAQLFWR